MANVTATSQKITKFLKIQFRNYAMASTFAATAVKQRPSKNNRCYSLSPKTSCTISYSNLLLYPHEIWFVSIVALQAPGVYVSSSFGVGKYLDYVLISVVQLRVQFLNFLQLFFQPPERRHVFCKIRGGELFGQPLSRLVRGF